MSIYISNHASARLKERVGIKGAKEKENYVRKAYFEGKREDDCTGISLKHIKKHKKAEFEARELVLYQDQIFVFEDQGLITVLSIDKKYAKNMNKNRCKQKKHNKYITE